jgi:CBS domain-containing protein
MIDVLLTGPGGGHVIERGQPVGMLTDRDIVVRAVADRRDVRITA